MIFTICRYLCTYLYTTNAVCNSLFYYYLFSGIERKNIETKIPIAEVVVCAGFLLVCFLEELIHHFVHPHKKSSTKKPSPPKNDTNIVIKENGTTALNEFEMYDAKSKGKFAQEPSTEESIESNDNHENDILNENNQGQEIKSLLRTAFVVASLSFHSAITGLTLGLEEEASGVWINLAAIASHKFVIAFSVGVEMVSSKVNMHYVLLCKNKNSQ